MYRDVTNVAKSLCRLSAFLPSRRLVSLAGRLSESVCATMCSWCGNNPNDFKILIENDLTFWAACALVTMKAYLAFRRQGFDIRAIRYEDLVARPLEISERVMEALGLPASFAENIHMCMQEDSQKNTPVSRAALALLRVPDVTPEIQESLDRLAVKYGLQPISKGFILEGTLL